MPDNTTSNDVKVTTDINFIGMADGDKVTGFEVKRDGVKLNDVTYSQGVLTIDHLKVNRTNHTADINLEIKAITKSHVIPSTPTIETINIGKARSGNLQSITAGTTTETSATVVVNAGAD